jgi:hypothetical protein
MSRMPAVMDLPLVADEEWVDIEDFEAAIEAESLRTSGFDFGPEQADAEFAAMLAAQATPIVESPANREAVEALFNQPLPPKRKLLRRRPLDE